MLRIGSKVLCLVLFPLALATNAGAGEGDTLITDPALLTSLGFPADARSVYLAKGALLNQRSTSAEPKEFGIVDFGWTTVAGSQHHPLDSDSGYTIDTAGGEIRRTSGSGLYEAQLQMPSGALLRQVVLFGRDDSGHVLSAAVIRVCQTGIPIGPPVATLLGSGDSSAASGSFVLDVAMPAAEVINNLSCLYLVRTNFHLGTTDLVLRKIRAGWQRQVSPAPATATFPNDVPTTHPFFQFIEALAEAGITAGCAPQSFCPDAPITRGQMAVFVAAALGL